MTEVLVIGGGVIGSSIARYLSKLDVGVTVLEKANDVSTGTSKANSGIAHAGFDAETGSIKARTNVRGNELIRKLHKKLNFHFKQTGAYVLCFDKNQLPQLQDLKKRGEENGVKGLKILSSEELKKAEPNVSSDVVAALYAPTSGVVCPYDMTVAIAENAVMNGAKFVFNTRVTGITKNGGGFKVETEKGKTYRADIVINAAGLFADQINNMISANKFEIIPRKGEYSLFDRTSGNKVKATMFQLPGKMGKGILVTPTADGNLLIGPTAADIPDKENVSTTSDGLSEVLTKAKVSVPDISPREIITQFTGLRAHLTSGDDFIVGEAADVADFYNAAGIESPGLTSALAIGEMLTDIIKKKYQLKEKSNFIDTRKGIIRFSDASDKEKQKLIAKNPLYGKMVCRCETVTEAEIVEALHSVIPAVDLDGIKRRTRAQMGRCQGGFCSPSIVEIIAREKNIPLTEVEKANGETVLKGLNKEEL